MNDKIQALEQIEELVRKFRMNEPGYLEDTYLEMSVRSNFIDLFFKALNWDVYGEKSLPVSESEVVREEHVSKESSKRVDYAFKVNGAVRFIVEAKKPSESLNNKNHIFQTKSYAFSMGVNLAILTNFREFKVFDLKSKPLYQQPDADCVAEFSLKYEEYPEAFDRIWELLEYRNVLAGSLERFYFENRSGMTESEIEESLKTYRKKGDTLLNRAFLEDLLHWRRRIAESIFERNQELDAYTLNEIVQRYIDRIIFMRIIEDRRIEGRDILRQICKEWTGNKSYSLHEKLEECFSRLNLKYNGILFKTYEGLGELEMEEETIYEFIMSLYAPNSPYNFAVIEVDILGKIFEQYLGYTIVIKAGEMKLECKDENKKNIGAYYTRREVVDKIVQESVDSVIHSISSLEELKKYKLLDMSCGSGTFLIEAYRSIVRRYEEIITERLLKGEEVPDRDYFVEHGRVHLTMSLKKEVVVNNIFGVDIDPQAIEVAKMSMYILMLELHYKDDSIRPILPALDENFKVGNSLVSEDYYEDCPIDMEEDRLVNPFDYEKEFPAVFEQGGFDCIIGNPPYIKIQVLNRAYPQRMIRYLNTHYPETARGNYDLYVIFLEKALRLLKSGGRLGMIVLNNFFTSGYGEGIRGLLSENQYIQKIVDLGDLQVFDHSRVYTCLLFLSKDGNEDFVYSRVEDYEEWRRGVQCDENLIPSKELDRQAWFFSDTVYTELEKTVFSRCQRMKDIAKTFGGVQPTINQIYLLTLVESDDTYEYCTQDHSDEVYRFEKGSLKMLVKGSRDIRMYHHSSNRRLIFPYEVEQGKARIIEEDRYRSLYPETYAYLCRFRDEIEEKHRDHSDSKPWYRYEYVKNHGRFEQPKILIPAMVYGSRFSYDREGKIYITCGGPSAGGGKVLTLYEDCDGYTFYSLLAILNSSLISYLIVRNGIPKSGGWQGIGKDFMDNLPVPVIKNSREKRELLTYLGKKAETLMELYEYETRSESDKKRRERRIVTLRREADRDVFRLYGIKRELYEPILRELDEKGYR